MYNSKKRAKRRLSLTLLGMKSAIIAVELFVYSLKQVMTTPITQKVTVFTVYNAEGDGCITDVSQYLFSTEKKALEACAAFMKSMLNDGIMFSTAETENLFAPLTLALAREDIRGAMDVFNDSDNQSRLQVSVKTLDVE